MNNVFIEKMMKSLSANAQEFIPSKSGAYSSGTPPMSSGNGTPLTYMLLNENNSHYQPIHQAMAMSAGTHQMPPSHAPFFPPAPPPSSILPVQTPISTLPFNNLNNVNFLYHQPQPQPNFQPPFRWIKFLICFRIKYSGVTLTKFYVILRF